MKSRGAFERLKFLTKNHKIQFIALQEPFVEAIHIEAFKRNLGFEGCRSNVIGKIRFFGQKLWRSQFVVRGAADHFEIEQKGL